MYIRWNFFSLSMKFFRVQDGIVMFSHYFKQFCILIQTAIKGPNLLQNRSWKSPDFSWKSFYPPITTYFSTMYRWQNFVAQALPISPASLRGRQAQPCHLWSRSYSGFQLPVLSSNCRQAILVTPEPTSKRQRRQTEESQKLSWSTSRRQSTTL